MEMKGASWALVVQRCESSAFPRVVFPLSLFFGGGIRPAGYEWQGELIRNRASARYSQSESATKPTTNQKESKGSEPQTVRTSCAAGPCESDANCSLGQVTAGLVCCCACNYIKPDSVRGQTWLVALAGRNENAGVRN